MAEIDEQAIQRLETALATPPTLVVDPDLMRLARENPRDEEEVMARVTKELRNHPTYADELFYSIPYKDNRKGLINFVEGPSIRAAEHLWTRWGNCTVAARIADDRGNKIMVQGLYLDHETGLRLFADMEVAKIATRKGGGSYPLNQNDLRIKVAATESKVKRNAFLSALPVWMKMGYTDMCFELVIGQTKKTMQERIVDARVFFMSRFKLEEKVILSLIEKIYASYPGIDEKGVLRYLIGIKNGIKDGNIDPDFVFGEQKEFSSMPQAKKKEIANGEQTTNPADAAGDAQE